MQNARVWGHVSPELQKQAVNKALLSHVCPPIAVEVNILLKTFVVLKRPELNGSLASDSATTGTTHGFRGSRILRTHKQDVRGYLGDDWGERSDWSPVIKHEWTFLSVSLCVGRIRLHPELRASLFPRSWKQRLCVLRQPAIRVGAVRLRASGWRPSRSF